MKYRKLRIAWSVAWGILCLQVIVLWVRSYRWFDDIAFLNSRSLISIQNTWEGSLSLAWSVASPRLSSEYYSRHFNTHTRESKRATDQELGSQSKAGKFDSYFSRSQWYVATPCWFLVITLSALAALPWLPLRFSLRTLLIGMTGIAIVMAAVTLLA